MAISLILPNDKLILSAFAAVGQAPGSANLAVHRDFVKASGVTEYYKALNSILDKAGVTNAQLADLVIANFGLASVTEATPAFLTSYFQANAGNRVAAVIELANLVSSWSGDAKYNTVRDAFNTKLQTSYNYAVTSANVEDKNLSDFYTTVFNLKTSQDTLTGTSGDDIFYAKIFDNANTLQSGDVIKAGTGLDKLFADIGASQKFAISPETTGLEWATFRVESTNTDGTDNNHNAVTVEIDAQRMEAVTQWTDSNSRADLVIEDVRIADGAKTKDVTIVMESTDPGNVDYGVYFDQHSLRNSSTSNTTLTIKIMDTGAAALDATKPLDNNPYDQFKIGVNGVLTTIQLDKTAVAAAVNYEQLLTVFQNALAGTGIVATIGANFTVTDPITSTTQIGKEILLTGSNNAQITEVAGSGWYNTTGASVPATSNIYTTWKPAGQTQSELVTSTIVLDDVGRGSTGGDLVVGGMSVDATPDSRGVERFEIEVRDNSKLQTINSTNDALREVTIESGDTTNTDNNQGAYDKTVPNQGNLTVNGNANAINAVTGQAVKGEGTDAPLSGLDALHHTAGYGFTDVRLIDATNMNGKLAYTAQITANSIKKYIDLVDTQNDPAGDVAGSGNVNYNVKGANFIYQGGTNNDTLKVDIDAGVAASRSKVVTGHSDFTFNVAGNGGDDAITVKLVGDKLTGGTAQDWYTNQKLNANITIDGGAGNDVIRKPGAGDATILAGEGNDVVYTDNVGSDGTAYNVGRAVWAFNTAVVAPLANADRDVEDTKGDANDSYNLSNATLTVTFKGLDVKVAVPSTGYKTTDLQINQAIKAAINNPDSVLSKLLVAEDGPSNSLNVRSLIDGEMAAGDLTLAIKHADSAALNATEIAALGTAYNIAAPVNAAAIELAWDNAIIAFANKLDYGATVAGAGNDVATVNATQFATEGGKALDGSDAVTTTDNTITLGLGNDVLVLSTTDQADAGLKAMNASNEKIVYTGAFGNDVIVNFTNAAAVATAAVAEAQQIDWNGVTATANGNITVGGVTVALAAADTGAGIAAKVTAALNAVAAGSAIGDANTADALTVNTTTFTGQYGDVANNTLTVVNGTAALDVLPKLTTQTEGVLAMAAEGDDLLSFKGIGADLTKVGSAFANGVAGDGITAALGITDGSLTIDDFVALVAANPANDSVATVKKLYTTAGLDAAVAATAKTMVYVAVHDTNIGDVYQVVDGTAVNDMQVTLLGTIDLADTTWASMAAADFA